MFSFFSGNIQLDWWRDLYVSFVFNVLEGTHTIFHSCINFTFLSAAHKGFLSISSSSTLVILVFDNSHLRDEGICHCGFDFVFSLMISYTEYLFMFLCFKPCGHVFLKMSIQICPFFNQIVVCFVFCFLLSCMGVLYIFGCHLQIFLHSVGYLFILLMVSFAIEPF